MQSSSAQRSPTDTDKSPTKAERSPSGTEKRKRWAVKLFREWLATSGHFADFEDMTEKQMAENLELMYRAMRSKKFGNHNARSIKRFRSGLKRYLSEPPVSKTYNISNHPAFRRANIAFAECIKKARTSEEWITKGDITKLYEEVFTDTKEGLQRRMYFEMHLHFGESHHKKLANLRKDGVVLQTDEQGREVVRLVVSSDREKGMLALPGDPKNCPVENYKKYIKQLNPLSPWFFQRGDGFSTRLFMIKTIFRESGLSRLYNNNKAIWHKNTVKIIDKMRKPLRQTQVLLANVQDGLEGSDIESISMEPSEDQTSDLWSSSDDQEFSSPSESEDENCFICDVQLPKKGETCERYNVTSLVSYETLQKIFPDRHITQGNNTDFLCSDCLRIVKSKTVQERENGGRFSTQRKMKNLDVKKVPQPKPAKKKDLTREACVQISRQNYKQAFLLLTVENESAKGALLNVAEEFQKAERRPAIGRSSHDPATMVQPTSLAVMNPNNCVVCGVQFPKKAKGYKRYTVTNFVSHAVLQKIFPDRYIAQGNKNGFLCSDCLRIVRSKTIPIKGSSKRTLRELDVRKIPIQKPAKKKDLTREACVQISSQNYRQAFLLLTAENNTAKDALLNVAEEFQKAEDQDMSDSCPERDAVEIKVKEPTESNEAATSTMTDGNMNKPVPGTHTIEEKAVDNETEALEHAFCNCESSIVPGPAEEKLRITSQDNNIENEEATQPACSADSSLVPPITIQPSVATPNTQPCTIKRNTEGNSDQVPIVENAAERCVPKAHCSSTAGNSEDVILTQDDYAETLRTNLLYLYKTNYHHDVFIATSGPEMISAHRLVLAANSPSIQAFLSNIRQRSVVLLGLEDFSYDDLRTVIDALYTGQLVLNAGNIKPVYRIVRKLNIEAMIDMCESVWSKLAPLTNISTFRDTHFTTFKIHQSELQTMKREPTQLTNETAPVHQEEMDPQGGGIPVEIVPQPMDQDVSNSCPERDAVEIQVKEEPTELNECQNTTDSWPGVNTIQVKEESAELNQENETLCDMASEDDQLDLKTRRSTNKQITLGVEKFRVWLSETGYSTQFETMETEELVKCLGKFYVEARDEEGNLYSRHALRNIRRAIQRHLVSPEVNRAINIVTDRDFANANAAYDNCIAERRRTEQSKVLKSLIISPCLFRGNKMKS